jgi:hypothetical protein
VTSIGGRGRPCRGPAQRDRLPLHAFLHDETYRAAQGEALDAVYAEREVRGWERYMATPRLKALASTASPRWPKASPRAA